MSPRKQLPGCTLTLRRFRWVSLQLQNLYDPRRIKVEKGLVGGARTFATYIERAL